MYMLHLLLRTDFYCYQHKYLLLHTMFHKNTQHYFKYHTKCTKNKKNICLTTTHQIIYIVLFFESIYMTLYVQKIYFLFFCYYRRSNCNNISIDLHKKYTWPSFKMTFSKTIKRSCVCHF